jgi:predicted nucleic acid-binding protein
MAYLLDADWAINALAGKRNAATTLRRLSPQGVAISWATVAELYEGAFNSPNPQALVSIYRGFLHPFRKLNLSDSIAERFAEIRSFLRRRGGLISDFDIMLAATALEYDLTVLTYNVQHLRRVPELGLYPAR